PCERTARSGISSTRRASSSQSCPPELSRISVGDKPHAVRNCDLTHCSTILERAGACVVVMNLGLVVTQSSLLRGALATLGGEQRSLSLSFPDGRCECAFSGRFEDPVDDHRVRVRLPVGKHRALPFPQ